MWGLLPILERAQDALSGLKFEARVGLLLGLDKIVQDITHAQAIAARFTGS